jgi:hypothetical protein
MGTREEFAPEVRREMERYRYSYSTEDLALLGFDRVLILDSEGIWDVADLVEFVHAQLLELSYYDRVLTEELERVPQVLRVRGLWGYGRLQRLMPFYADSLVLGHQWNRVCRLRVSGSWARTRHRSATTSIISSRS